MRRRSPYQGDVYTVPLISREQNGHLLSFLTEGVVSSGEAEYAREKLLLPMIDDLAKIIDELENARVETGDPMTPFIDTKLQAEYSLAEVLYDVLTSVDKRITTEQRSSERNPRRNKRLKRHY